MLDKSVLELGNLSGLALLSSQYKKPYLSPSLGRTAEVTNVGQFGGLQFGGHLMGKEREEDLLL